MLRAFLPEASIPLCELQNARSNPTDLEATWRMKQARRLRSIVRQHSSSKASILRIAVLLRGVCERRLWVSSRNYSPSQATVALRPEAAVEGLFNWLVNRGQTTALFLRGGRSSFEHASRLIPPVTLDRRFRLQSRAEQRCLSAARFPRAHLGHTTVSDTP